MMPSLVSERTAGCLGAEPYPPGWGGEGMCRWLPPANRSFHMSLVCVCMSVCGLGGVSVGCVQAATGCTAHTCSRVQGGKADGCPACYGPRAFPQAKELFDTVAGAVERSGNLISETRTPRDSSDSTSRFTCADLPERSSPSNTRNAPRRACLQRLLQAG